MISFSMLHKDPALTRNSMFCTNLRTSSFGRDMNRLIRLAFGRATEAVYEA